MITFLGAVTGILAFLPLFLSLRAGKKVTDKSNFGYVAISLLGVFASLLILIAAVALCYFFVYDELLRFALAAAITLIAFAVVYGIYTVVGRNKAAKERKQQLEDRLEDK